MSSQKNMENFMYRLTINLSDVDFEKIQKNAKNKSLSLSEYGRKLIDLGLQAEQVMTEKGMNNTHLSTCHLGINEPKLSKKILKNLLAWQLESRFLIRSIVEQDYNDVKVQSTDLLTQAKKIARQQINVMLGEPKDSEDF